MFAQTVCPPVLMCLTDIFSIALHVCSNSVSARPHVSYRYIPYCSTCLLKQCAHPSSCVLQTYSVLLYMFAQTVCPPAPMCLTDMFSIVLHVCSNSVPTCPHVSYRHVQYCTTCLLKQCAHPPSCVLQTCSVLHYMFAQTVCPPALMCLTDMFSIALHVCSNSVPTCPHVSYRHVQYFFSCLLKQCAHPPSCVLQTCSVLLYMFDQTVCPPALMYLTDMFSIALHVCLNSVPTRSHVSYRHVQYCCTCLLKQCVRPPSCVLQTCSVLLYMFAQTVCPPALMCLTDMFSIALHVCSNSVPTRPHVSYKHVQYCSTCLLKQCVRPPSCVLQTCSVLLYMFAQTVCPPARPHVSYKHVQYCSTCLLKQCVCPPARPPSCVLQTCSVLLYVFAQTVCPPARPHVTLQTCSVLLYMFPQTVCPTALMCLTDMFSIALPVCSNSVSARPHVSYRHVQYCSTCLLKQCVRPPSCVLQTCSVLLYMFAQTVCPTALMCLTDMFSIALHVPKTAWISWCDHGNHVMQLVDIYITTVCFGSITVKINSG